MAIQHWDPMREMTRLQERVNRLFEDAFARSEGPRDLDQLAGGGWRPAMDLHETDERYVVRVDLPGVAPADVEIQVEESSLIIKGERKPDPAMAREPYLRRERPMGPFSLQVVLPPSIEREAIKASHRDGVLEVTLPKRAKAVAGRIRVEVQ